MSAIQFPQDRMNGTVTAVLKDVNGSPSNVIAGDKPLTIRVDWTQNTANLLGGTWHISCKAEAFGPGPDLVLASPPAPVDAFPDGAKFAEWTIDPNPLAKGEEYKLIMVLRHRDQAGNPTTLAGLVEFEPVAVV